MQALKEQQEDYSQGKVPGEPVDETQSGTLTGERLIDRTMTLKSERISAQGPTTGQKKSPSALTHGDLKQDVQ